MESMMTADFKKYENAIAFRRALEDRLKNISLEQSIPLDRLRRRVTFDRFLARLFETNRPRSNQQWLLKGGYALEFRFHSVARTTKDIDFSISHMNDPDENTIRELLQAEAKKDMSDWFQFYIGVPMREFDQAVYGGWRYPVEQHFAEKIHAYSYPREKRTFSRIRDLVDLALLIEQGLPDKGLVMSAIEATFKRRNTHHDIPQELEIPPKIVEDSYAEMAEDCGVTKKTMAEAFSFLQEYWLELRK